VNDVGFDISAIDDKGNEIAYLRAHMATFRMLIEQGYNWFDLIDAEECNGGISGTGAAKYIRLRDLQHALYILDTHDTRSRLGYLDSRASPVVGEYVREAMKSENQASMDAMMKELVGEATWNQVKNVMGPDSQDVMDKPVSKETTDRFSEFKPALHQFMASCILWCLSNGTSEIKIHFG